jgi:hypothetical protein
MVDMVKTKEKTMEKPYSIDRRSIIPFFIGYCTLARSDRSQPLTVETSNEPIFRDSRNQVINPETQS